MRQVGVPILNDPQGTKVVPLALTREALLDGSMRRMIESSGTTQRLLTDEEHKASLARIMATCPGKDVWLFGYGSLIWNPAIRFEERRVGTIYGYHRRFCLWTRLGRGSQANPGLMLALEPGGACQGVAFRIGAAEAAEEMALVWKREMIMGSYRPRWVKVVTSEGPVWAITFVMNRAHENYAGVLSEERVAAVIANASGALGPCAAYLFNTVDHLGELGIHDRRLSRLKRLVAERQAVAEKDRSGA